MKNMPVNKVKSRKGNPKMLAEELGVLKESKLQFVFGNNSTQRTTIFNVDPNYADQTQQDFVGNYNGKHFFDNNLVLQI